MSTGDNFGYRRKLKNCVLATGVWVPSSTSPIPVLQSHKGSNNIQNVRVCGNDTSNRTVNDGGAVDKTNSGGDTATVQFNDSDLTSGVADHMFTSFAGYLYWGTGWDSAVQTADNRMVRVSVTATEGLNLFCDGKIVAAQSRESTHGITGGGTGVRQP